MSATEAIFMARISIQECVEAHNYRSATCARVKDKVEAQIREELDNGRSIQNRIRDLQSSRRGGPFQRMMDRCA